MSAPNELQEEIVVDSHHNENSASPLLSPQTTMLVLTWIVFFLLLAVLKKFAWGPILKSLDKRENDIRQSVDNADRLEKELSEIESKRSSIITKADEEGKELISQARKASVEAGNHLKAEAKKETQILFENAQRAISEEQLRARADLKKDTVNIAVELASKLIQENLDEAKNKKLIDQIIDKM